MESDKDTSFEFPDWVDSETAEEIKFVLKAYLSEEDEMVSAGDPSGESNIGKDREAK